MEALEARVEGVQRQLEPVAQRVVLQALAAREADHTQRLLDLDHVRPRSSLRLSSRFRLSSCARTPRCAGGDREEAPLLHVGAEGKRPREVAGWVTCEALEPDRHA